MLLKHLIEDLNIKKVKGNIETDIAGIAYDSRKVKKGFLFVCISGTQQDGHAYIPMALENGASALLVEKDIDLESDVPVIMIDNTRYGLAHVADRFFGHPSGKLDLVGVTGTKGKTTTTYMIKSILDISEKTGIIGTLGTKIGDRVLYSERTTPESYDLQSILAQMCDEGVKKAVMEVSSQGLALHRVAMCEYEIGVFTNLSKDHISKYEHSSMEEYMEAKLKLFDMSKKAVINLDNPYSKYFAERAKGQKITVGIENEAMVMAKDIRYEQQGVSFKMITPWFEQDMSINIPGKFSVYNALCASAVCGLLNIDKHQIYEGLRNVYVPGRVEKVDTGRDFTVLIDYAHTPDSLENVLNTIKAFAKGRIICLFGCGGDRDRTKRPLMGEISGRLADFTIITSDNPRTEDPDAIISEIEKGVRNTSGEYICITDRRQAIKHALMNAKKNDIILLAGKGHETYQTFKDKTIHFDEREVVAELLKEI